MSPDPAWSPSSWKSKHAEQLVSYEDQAALSKVLNNLERLPPIVTPTEIVKLRKSLQDVALGKAFLLQGGDCAELFDYCQQDIIESKIKLLLQMSLVLIWGGKLPVVRIARMAGQYAKPRSSPFEVHNGVKIPSFRGDILNGFDPEERELDPKRLLAAYHHSSATLNYIRGAISSGIADLHSPLDWELGHVRDTEIKAQYEVIVERIRDNLGFMKTIGADTSSQHLDTVDLFTSHEGLVLDYEQRLTRKLKHPSNRSALLSITQTQTETEGYYNTSAHFIWIGDRTRQLNGAHVEYFRGIENPIGLKIGPSLQPSELISLLDILNPSRSIGKITLITRFGAAKISSHLPAIIQTVQNSPHAGTVVWQCDPMHGNTLTTSSGIKTRRFEDILSEVSQALKIHKQEGSFLGGVHLELTGDAVTECMGGSQRITDDDLSLNYTTFCDPRLNEKQALELAFLVAREHRENGGA